ncbi:MAG: multiheme c-type cytochrome [Candidatus Aminicenantia bacterium]
MRITSKILLVIGFFFIAVSFVYSQHTYIGVDKCKICHKAEAKGNQYGKWLESKHSKAYQLLATPKAEEIGGKTGIKNPSESEKCMSCHSPYGNIAPELKADGVGCEACHGPGSDYKAMNIMKDRALAQKNGLIIHENENTIKTHCLNCHKKDNPYHSVPEFDFTTAWKTIAHPIPK